MVETNPKKRLIGYARLSTVGQTLDSQLEQLRAAGCSSRNIYREKATGARPDRRELNKMLDKLAPGDVVTVTEGATLSEPARSYDVSESTIS
jgi:DNA invertase Pin-like site-specific DNA recombinase